jgi:uncharacterized protein (TIGR02757 family)
VRCTATSPRALKDCLEALAERYDERFLDTDPVGIVRRYDRPEDREIVAFLAAGLAYGRVASIRGSLERLVAILGARPSRFVDAFDPSRDARRFDGFTHRFHAGSDVALYLGLLARAKASAGSLEAFWLRGAPSGTSGTIGEALDAFGQRLFALDPRATDRVRFFLPLPRSGSVCKRSCLLLRWLVRPDDGVDCGVWTRVGRERLVLPLDTHLIRVVKALGWTRRKSPGWGMALEATARLRLLDPGDPVRFDFALSRLGILGLVRARRGRLRRGAIEAALAASAAGPRS